MRQAAHVPEFGRRRIEERGAASDEQSRRVGHHVGTRARLRRYFAFIQRLGAREGYFQVRDAFLARDYGEVSVGRERGLWDLAVPDVMLYALAARFLVAACYEPHPAAEIGVLPPQPRERVQAGHERPLVVAHAAAVHIPVLHRQPERIVRPAPAGGHDVEMGEHADKRLSLAVFRPARITAVAARFQPVSGGFFQKQGECARVFFAERSVFLRLPEHTFYFYEFREIV